MISLVSEGFAEDVDFTKKMVCTDNILTLQCQLSDPTRVGDTMYYINIQQRNISELYEDIVTIKNKPVNESVVIWYNDTIEHISSTEESSIYPANEARLIVQINLNSLREVSMMLRCTIYGKGFGEELKYDLTVRKEDTSKFC